MKETCEDCVFGVDSDLEGELVCHGNPPTPVASGDDVKSFRAHVMRSEPACALFERHAEPVEEP